MEHLAAFCPAFQRAAEIVGRRWNGAILRALLSGKTRFSDITGCIPGLSDRLLSARLKELEAEGIVMRQVMPDTPVRVDYQLTERGRALAPVVEAVSDWAERWLANSDGGCPAARGERADELAVAVDSVH